MIYFQLYKQPASQIMHDHSYSIIKCYYVVDQCIHC